MEDYQVLYGSPKGCYYNELSIPCFIGNCTPGPLHSNILYGLVEGYLVSFTVPYLGKLNKIVQAKNLYAISLDGENAVILDLNNMLVVYNMQTNERIAITPIQNVELTITLTNLYQRSLFNGNRVNIKFSPQHMFIIDSYYGPIKLVEKYQLGTWKLVERIQFRLDDYIADIIPYHNSILIIAQNKIFTIYQGEWVKLFDISIYSKGGKLHDNILILLHSFSGTFTVVDTNTWTLVMESFAPYNLELDNIDYSPTMDAIVVEYGSDLLTFPIPRNA